MGEAAALIAALCWAGTSVALAHLSTKYSGAMLSGLRFLIASPFLIVLFLATGGIDTVARASLLSVAIIVLSAVANYGIGDTVYVRALPRVGVQRMSPVTSALWVAMSTLGGVVLLDEAGGVNLIVGGVLVIGGTFLVISARIRDLPGLDRPDRPGRVVSLLLMLVVAGSWTASSLLVAGGHGSLDALAATAIRVPFGGALIAAVLVTTTRGEVLRRLPEIRDLPLLLAVGVLGTGGSALASIYAVTEAGAARASILNSTSVLMVVPLSMIFLGERPTARTGVGTVLCLAGTLAVVAG